VGVLPGGERNARAHRTIDCARLIGGAKGVGTIRTVHDDREHVDPLQRLRWFIRTFVKVSAHRPELLRIVDGESTQASERLDYLCATYILPMAARYRPLVEQLIAEARIRPIPLETIYYMITSGGAALYASDAMTTRLFGQLPRTESDIDRHADAAADLLIGGLSSQAR
jgi:hypothetical protein